MDPLTSRVEDGEDVLIPTLLLEESTNNILSLTDKLPDISTLFKTFAMLLLLLYKIVNTFYKKNNKRF